MAGKYDELARKIVDYVGGAENVRGVTHCITRVRFRLKDESKTNTEALEKTDGVIKVMSANGQYQVVVGNKVEEVYDAVLAVGHLSGGGEVAADDADDEPKGIGARLIDLISGIFQPVLGAFAAAGIMKGILALVTQFYPDFALDGAYTVLYTVADGMFYFLPVALAFTAAKKFKMNEFTGVSIGFALVYPTMVALTSGEILGSIDLGFLGMFSWYAEFFGIPIIMPAAGYTSSVIPILLMVWFGSVVEHWCKRWMPASLKMFFTPLLTMTLAIVLGYLIIGPVATLITNILSSIFQLVFNLPVVGSALGGALVAALWMPLVIFGFHWSLVPFEIVNLSTLQYDYVLACMVGHSFALGAVIFAMYLKSRDENFRGIALPAMISAFFFGVTEPGIYGIALPDKKALVNACVGAAVGGVIIGALGAHTYMSGGLGVFNWLSFIDINGIAGVGMSHMWIAVAGSLASAVVGFAIEIVTYRPKLAVATASGSSMNAGDSETAASLTPASVEAKPSTGVICAPVSGRVIAMSDVPDPVFSGETLGKGCAVWPDGDVVYAPASGTVSAAMGHAVGVTTDDGIEILVHVGVDTVDMEGNGFTSYAGQGERVVAGQPVLGIDRAAIRAAGHPDCVVVAVSNSDEFADVALLAEPEGTVAAGAAVLRVTRA